MVALICPADPGRDDHVCHHAVPRRRRRLHVRLDQEHHLCRLRAPHHLAHSIGHQLARHRHSQSGTRVYTILLG